MKPTIVRAVRPAANFSPTAPCLGCSKTTGRGPLRSGRMLRNSQRRFLILGINERVSQMIRKNYIGSKNSTHVVLLSFLFSGFQFCPAAHGQGLEYVKAHYTKYEFRIPMRDGKKLFTAVYVPKDQSQRYPMMLARTPYSVGPYGADQYKSDLGPSPL